MTSPTHLLNPTIVRLARAALFGRRRVWALLALPLLVCAVAFLTGVLADEPSTGWDFVTGVWLPLLVPLLALLAASSVLGPEIDDGSIVYLLAKPVSRHTVVRSKFTVAALATLVLGTLPVLLLGLLMPPPGQGRPGDLALALALGSGVAGLAYVALFLAMTAAMNRSVMAAILFVFVWEQTITGLLSGAQTLSVSAWGTRIAGSVTTLDPMPQFALWWAWTAPVVLVVGGVWWAGDRMRSFTLRNDDA